MRHKAKGRFRLACLVLLLAAAGCASLPRVELSAYTSAYSDILVVTNGILDIVAPYERVVIRYAARSTTRTVAVRNEAFAQAVDPSLLANPEAARPAPAPDPSLLANPPAVRPARPAPQPDPSLLANPPPARTQRPLPLPDPTLLADPGRAPPQTTSPAPTAPQPTIQKPAPAPVQRAVTTTIAIERACSGGYGGADPFCYETRDGYADIGDPPLVGAYRNMANVVLRFNRLLVAYASGVSGRLLAQEVGELSSSVNELTRLAPISGISGGFGVAASFANLAASLAPIAGGAYDRTQLRTFLLANYDTVDQALGLMARNSVELYANVAIGTQLFQIRHRGFAESLNPRRREIRRLIANWTVVLDHTRRILAELKLAIELPDGLETRLRNLNETAVMSRIDTNTIKKQIAGLGAPVLPP